MRFWKSFVKLMITPFNGGKKEEIARALGIWLAFLALVVAIWALFPPSKKASIRYNKENSIIAKVCSRNPVLNNMVGVMFYQMKLMGESEKATSVDKVQFYIDVNGEWREGDKINVYVSKREGKAVENCASIKAKDLQTGKVELICVGDWKDLALSYNRTLSYGDAELGCAVFAFDLPYDQVRTVQKMKFLVTDNFGEEFDYVFENDLLFSPNGLKAPNVEACILDYRPSKN